MGLFRSYVRGAAKLSNLKILTPGFVGGRRKGAVDGVCFEATLGANPGLFHTGNTDDLIGRLDLFLTAPNALGRLCQRFVLTVPEMEIPS